MNKPFGNDETRQRTPLGQRDKTQRRITVARVAGKGSVVGKLDVAAFQSFAGDLETIDD